MTSTKAKVTTFDNGKIVVEPYAQTSKPRYTPLLELEYGTLSTTNTHFRLLLMIPRKEGLLATARHILNAATQVGNFFTNLYIHGAQV